MTSKCCDLDLKLDEVENHDNPAKIIIKNRITNTLGLQVTDFKRGRYYLSIDVRYKDISRKLLNIRLKEYKD